MTKSSRCSTCQKQAGVMHCIGCDAYFCAKDFRGHREILFNKIDGLVEERNNLQDKINKATQQNDSRSPLIEKINEWEKNTIEKVKQVAENARQQAFQLLNSKHVNIANRFKGFSEELSDSKETENFVEQDLERFKQMIRQFHRDVKQLTQPTTIAFNTKESDGINWNRLIFVQEKSTNDERQQPQQQEIREQRPAHNPSKNLLANELQLLYEVLGQNCVTLATASAAEISHVDHDTWSIQASGIFCFVKDYGNRNYCFRSYDLKLGHAIYEEIVPASLRLEKASDNFYTFDGSNCQIGINFVDHDEAQTFSRDFHSSQEDRLKKKKGNASPEVATTTVNTPQKSKITKKSAFLTIDRSKKKNICPDLSAPTQSTSVKDRFFQDDAQRQLFEDTLASLHLSAEDKVYARKFTETNEGLQKLFAKPPAPVSSPADDTSSGAQDTMAMNISKSLAERQENLIKPEVEDDSDSSDAEWPN